MREFFVSMRRFFYISVLIFFGIFVGLVFSELLFRVLDSTGAVSIDPKKSFAKDDFVYHPTLKYTIKPYRTRDCTVTGNPKAVCYANSNGFRDTDHTIQKLPNTFRILLLGDSLTYGPGVNFQDSYPGIFEKIVNKNNLSGKNIEVIKMGMIFYAPQQYYYMYEEYGRKYNPDLIIVSFHLLTDPFDAYDFYKNERFYYLKSIPDKIPYPINQHLKENSYVWRFLLSVYYGWANKQENREFINVRDKFENPKNRYQYETQLTVSTPVMRKGWEQAEIFLDSLIKKAVINKAKIAIVAFPSPAQIDPDEWKNLKEKGYVSDRRLYTNSAAREKFISICGRHNWMCLDLQEEMRKSNDPKKLFLRGDIHYTKEGNSIAAQAIYQFLNNNKNKTKP